MCTRVHIYTNNSSFPIKGVRNRPQVINHARTELVKHPSSEHTRGKPSLTKAGEADVAPPKIRVDDAVEFWEHRLFTLRAINACCSL